VTPQKKKNTNNEEGGGVNSTGVGPQEPWENQKDLFFQGKERVAIREEKRERFQRKNKGKSFSGPTGPNFAKVTLTFEKEKHTTRRPGRKKRFQGKNCRPEAQKTSMSNEAGEEEGMVDWDRRR